MSYSTTRNLFYMKIHMREQKHVDSRIYTMSLFRISNRTETT